VNPRDEIAFKRLAQLLPGIAARGADKLWKLFQEKMESHALTTPKNPLATALQSCSKNVGAKTSPAWAQFTATVSQLEDETARKSASKMLQLVIDAGYDDYLKETYANYRSRLDDLEQLAAFAFQFGTVEEFLTQLALLTNVEAEDEQAAKSEDEKIKLSTIHQAKGLEFGIVFVIMLCDGLFPSARAMESTDGEEEERRLFYVSITRAKNELYLTYPLIRGGFGNSGNDAFQSPSRFLSEIPKDLVNEWNLRPANLYR
jgi:DNA helicase-2/ATP-dependent DNA helicase PcrA